MLNETPFTFLLSLKQDVHVGNTPQECQQRNHSGNTPHTPTHQVVELHDECVLDVVRQHLPAEHHRDVRRLRTTELAATQAAICFLQEHEPVPWECEQGLKDPPLGRLEKSPGWTPLCGGGAADGWQLDSAGNQKNERSKSSLVGIFKPKI